MVFAWSRSVCIMSAAPGSPLGEAVTWGEDMWPEGRLVGGPRPFSSENYYVLCGAPESEH
jgi:hypothetical protein